MAGGIPESVIEEIKARTDLADLISSYGIQVKAAGSSKKACCPFHNEKTPSFNINEQKGFYHCFGCGESGDAFKFVMKMDGLSFIEAAKKLAERCGVKIEEKEDPTAGKRKRLLALMAELAAFYHRCLLQTREAQAARDYLKSRDLSPEVQESFLIGYAPNGMVPIRKWAEKHGFTLAELEEAGVIKAPRDASDNGYHRFGGRLMFSIRDKAGRVVAFSGRQLVANKNSGKYVNSPETLIFKKSNVLFGFDKAAGNIAKSPHHEVIVCEGQIDTIRLHISGFPIAVASQGTAFTEEHVKMVKKVSDQVTLCFDDDGAGHKATIRTARLFLAAGMPVRTVSLPGGDDPDSFLRTHPAAEFQALLDNAASIIAFQVRAERAKERRPDTIDAISRISTAILETIAHSDNAILRASMVQEAAKLLHMPEIALSSELEKVKRTPPRPQAPEPMEEEIPKPSPESSPLPEAPAGPEVVDAHAAIPPSRLEFQFCGFLMVHERTPEIEGLLGDLLPSTVFRHAFTRKFVELWRAECTQGKDLLTEWNASLSPLEKKWFAAICANQDKQDMTEAESNDPDKVQRDLENFICALWVKYLEAVRGSLPANSRTREELIKSFEVTTTLPKLKNPLQSDDIKTIIHKLIEGGY